MTFPSVPGIPALQEANLDFLQKFSNLNWKFILRHWFNILFLWLKFTSMSHIESYIFPLFFHPFPLYLEFAEHITPRHSSLCSPLPQFPDNILQVSKLVNSICKTGRPWNCLNHSCREAGITMWNLLRFLHRKNDHNFQHPLWFTSIYKVLFINNCCLGWHITCLGKNFSENSLNIKWLPWHNCFLEF